MITLIPGKLQWILKPGGTVFSSSPSTDGLSFRLRVLLYGLIRKIFWPGLAKRICRENRRDFNKLKQEALKIRKSGLFDLNYYAKQYPEVIRLKIDPLIHFILFGQKEGLKPNPIFEPDWYAGQKPEDPVRQDNPLAHYLDHWKNGDNRPHPWFSDNFYLMEHPELNICGVSPLSHFLHKRENHPIRPIKSGIPAETGYTNASSVALICHIYDPGFWSQISGLLKSLNFRFSLFISLPENLREMLEPDILHEHPTATVRCFPNRGRDMCPFIEFLPEIYRKGHVLFCKVHSKRDLADSGFLWRRIMLQGLLGDDSVIHKVQQLFARNDDLFMIGPETLYLSGRTFEYGNRPYMEKIWQHLYPGEHLPTEWGFFAGSMFWGRTAAFLPLAQVITDRFTFESDNIPEDGQLAHALERIFGAVAVCQSKTIGLIKHELAIMSPQEIEMIKAPGKPSRQDLQTIFTKLLEISKFVRPNQ